MTLHPTGATSSTADRVTQNLLRLAGPAGGQQGRRARAAAASGTSVHRPIIYTIYDNLGEATTQYQYDGDGVTSPTTSGVPDIPSRRCAAAGARAPTSYDEQGRVYQTKVFSVNQSNGSVVGQRADEQHVVRPRGERDQDSPTPAGWCTKTSTTGRVGVTKTYATDGGGDSELVRRRRRRPATRPEPDGDRPTTPTAT